MSQELPIFNFKWAEDTSQLNEDFIKKTILKKVKKDIFLKLMFNIQKKYIYELHNDLPFLPERKKLEKVGSLLLTYMIK